MNVDCTLNTFKVPGFSGLNPEFGLKKPNGESISAREAYANAAMPFVLMRPHIVNENSTTTQVEVNSVFDTTVAGITLTLGDAAYNGCMAYIVNSSGDSVSILVNGGTETIRLYKGEFLDLEYANGKWKKRSGTKTANADMVDGAGRNLLEVLGVSTIPEAMAELRRRCNNNGEIDASGVPDFSGLMIGDYIDGIDLSGIAAPPNGTAPQAWNNTYKNNRIVVSGFNTYKGTGGFYWDEFNELGGENDKNHILFTFRNVILLGRINSTYDNTGGYKDSELRQYLEGQYGKGNGILATKLKQQLGGEYLYTINKYHDNNFAGYTLWVPSEIEVFGMPLYGDEGKDVTCLTPIQIPIYQKSYEYRVKRWNGARYDYWLKTSASVQQTSFCCSSYDGISTFNNQSAILGVSPVFCVA